MDSVVAQAEDRHQCYTRNVEDYFKIRRLTIGTDPSYAMLELGYDLPDEVFYHPTVVELGRLACDLIIIDNVRPSGLSRAATLTVFRILLRIIRNRHRRNSLITSLCAS